MAGWTHERVRLHRKSLSVVMKAACCRRRIRQWLDAATCASVMTGLDTDCNSATVGSVVGVRSGRSAYRGRLAQRLNDTIKPAVFGFQEVRMIELAQRHAAVWRRVDDWRHRR